MLRTRWWHGSSRRLRPLRAASPLARPAATSPTPPPAARRPPTAAPALERNEAGVQLLPSALRRQVFGEAHRFGPPDPDAVEISRRHLAKHGLSQAEERTIDHVDLDLPPLQGATLTEHFHNIAYEECEEPLRLAEAFAAAVLPPLPDHWQEEAGWTQYEADGSFHSVPHPPTGVALVFDVETMYPEYRYPIMAVAATSEAWFAWVSPYTLGQSPSIEHLVPMPAEDERGQRRVIVGHNVCYDRARIEDEYSLRPTGNRFIDTMSLHIARRGLSNPQRPEWMRRKKGDGTHAGPPADGTETGDETETRSDEAAAAAATDAEALTSARDMATFYERLFKHVDLGAPKKAWYDVATTNGLADVIELHFQTKLDKAPRDLFGPGASRESIRAEFHELLTYCASDVLYTHQLYRYSLPDFRAACPSPTSFAGQLHMASAVLPVDSSWPKFVADAEAKFEELQQGISRQLFELAETERRRVYEMPPDGGKFSYETDPWLRQLDWSPVKVRPAPASDRPSGPPAWSIALGPDDPATAILLRVCTSTGEPLRWDRGLGWYLARDTRPMPILADGKPLTRLFAQRGARLTLAGSTKDEAETVIQGWSDLTVAGLQEACRYHGLPKTGKKGEMLGRLLQTRNFDPAPGLIDMTVAQLRASLRDRGLLTGGTRSQLLARLCVASLPPDLFTEQEVVVDLTSPEPVFEAAYRDGDPASLDALRQRIAELSTIALERGPSADGVEDHLAQLDWSPAVIVTGSEGGDERQLDNLRPRWYKQLRQGGDLHLSLRSRIAPLLMRCSWTGFPLVYSAQHGWTYKMPANFDNPEHGESGDSESKRLTFTSPKDVQLHDDELDEGVIHLKVPHPSGDLKRNTGNPLAKDFAKQIENDILTTNVQSASDMLRAHIACSYWMSTKKRIESQFVVQQSEQRPLGLPLLPADDPRYPLGLILPTVVPMGTVTRRAVESTWLTASNSKTTRVGSEIKSRVRAPPGWAIIGADVDSEELWICSILGDAKFGFHGATALGWQTLEGSKAAGTDMHSMTAKTINVSRDRAKVFNYSRLYGAGRKFAQQELIKGDPLLTSDEARDKATKLYETTKGRSVSRRYGGNIWDGDAQTRLWSGGSESLVFNALEDIARSKEPRTPTLGASITEALSYHRLKNATAEPNREPTGRRTPPSDAYLTSRVNWVVQSSGVDFLHMLIVSMGYLCRHYAIRARYMLSVHDELRYLVLEDDKYRAALALQIAHIWTRAYFAFRLSMDDLPASCAFFSLIDIDHVLRKETNDPCITPSSPEPVPPGEALDIYQIIERTKGQLRPGTGNSDTSSPSTRRVYTPADDPPGAVHREADLSLLERQALGVSDEELSRHSGHRWKRKSKSTQKLQISQV